MKDIKKNFIRNSASLYIFNALVVSVIIIFSINLTYADQNDKKPLNLWENNSLLGNDEDNKEDLNSSNSSLTNISNNSKKEINQSSINVSSLDSIGIYDESNGGFPISLWKNSNFKQIEYLLNELPSDTRNTFLKS